MSKIFTPHELKTIEVDVEKKIFRINGEDFGEDCTGFAIYCKGYRDFEIRVEVDTKVVITNYGFSDLRKEKEIEYHTNHNLFSKKTDIKSPEEEIRKIIREEIEGNVISECHLEVG